MEVPVLEREFKQPKVGEETKSTQGKEESKKDEKINGEGEEKKEGSSEDDDDIQITDSEEDQDPSKNTRVSGSLINEMRRRDKLEKKKIERKAARKL